MNNPVIGYLRESKGELEKVSWPTRKETIRYSIAVMVFTLILGAFFAVVDQVFNLGMIELLDLSGGSAPAPAFEISDITETPVTVDAPVTIEEVN